MVLNQFRRLSLIVISTSVFFVHCLSSAQSSGSASSREFIMSCTYGTLAGTLVGAASLGFESNPGDNLNRIAKGASIGLYAGILLGLYVVYIVPGQMEKAREDRLRKQMGQFDLVPTTHPLSRSIDGAVAHYRILDF